jgi:hypothetical protein
MPLREVLGLSGKQPMTPAMEDRLCHLATVIPSYQRAAEAASHWGVAIDDSQLQRLVQRVGARAAEQDSRRVERAFDPRGNRELVREAKLAQEGERFSMILMLDGTMLRLRGKDWGMKPTSAPSEERVVWHELKAGVVLRISEPSAGRKRPEVGKWYIASADGPEEVGRKLYAEAARRGLEQAERVYVIADGAAWIWRVAEEHFPGSVEQLDFYHASEHLWALARSLWKEDDGKVARQWAVPLLHALKHQGGGELLAALEQLRKTMEDLLNANQRQDLEREAAYFRNHASRLDYPGAKRQGMPLGSGTMESACSQIQGRFKRPGQFWTRPGEKSLMTLDMAWRNRDWKEIWTQTG